MFKRMETKIILDEEPGHHLVGTLNVGFAAITLWK